mmetsp:Transcript_5810/g.12243  ORF Transcript_5810/g.12243 Transcript_5810/m.12243 type:complete len:281 (+) Transcript_5810:172-1014(+)
MPFLSQKYFGTNEETRKTTALNIGHQSNPMTVMINEFDPPCIEVFSSNINAVPDEIHIHSGYGMACSPDSYVKEQPKKLNFSTCIETIPSLCKLDQPLTREEKRRTWYSARELLNFRNEAKELCRELRSTEELFFNARSKICTMSRDQETRGLEQRACMERQRRKFLCNKKIVESQHEMNGDLAVMAHRYTRWAMKLAQEEAFRDYLRAYVVFNEDQIYWDETQKRIAHRRGEVFSSRTSSPSIIEQSRGHSFSLNGVSPVTGRRVRRRVSHEFSASGWP